MSKIALAAVASLLAAAGCTSSSHSAEAKAKDGTPVAAKAAWQQSEHVDEMSDKKAISLTNADQPIGTAFGFVCDEDGVTVFFSGPTYLGDRTDADLEYRIDNQKPAEGWIFTQQSRAMFQAPAKPDRSDDALDLHLAHLTAQMFVQDVSSASHQRLRVRFRTSDHEVVDLEFDISGLRGAWPAYQRRCASVGTTGSVGQ